MRTRTVDWTAPRGPGTGTGEGEGLRERKKRLMRQQLSDTATQMFLEQGFDAVRVTEIAEACGVSEKTVFNYFPTKESLILDRLEATVASLRTGLAEPEVPPVQAALRILDGELVAGIVLGWNFGDGHLHDERLLEAVQKQCAFEEGELRCIFVESQPFGRPWLHWRIADAKSGRLEEGRLAIPRLLTLQPWESSEQAPSEPALAAVGERPSIAI